MYLLYVHVLSLVWYDLFDESINTVNYSA